MEQSDPEQRLQRSLAGDTTLAIDGVMREAWSRVAGSKLVLFATVAAFYLVLIPATALLGALLRGFGLNPEAGFGGLVLQLAVGAALYPFIGGALMVAVRRSCGRPIEPRQLFRYYDRTLEILLLNVFTSVLVMLGTFLLILPGIYLAVAYSLAMPLMLDRGLGVWDAMETSRKLVTRHWFRVFALLVAGAVVLAVATLPLLLGLIWALPWFFLLLGVLYRDLAGVASLEDAGLGSREI